MHLSCCLWGSTLGATTCTPCRLVLPPSGSLHQGTLKGSCMEECSADQHSHLWLWSLGVPLTALFSTMVATLWSMHAYRNRPHSCFWALFQPRCSLHNSLKNSWLWRVWSATQFEQPVLWMNSLAHTSNMEEISIMVGWLTLPSCNKWWMF